MVLVIGGSGFLGTELISRNVKTIKWLNFDKQKSSEFNDISIKGDIRDVSSFKDTFKDIDTVVLLAAEHRDDVTPKSLYYDVNVQGTMNVLNEMDKNNITKIIFTSSVAVYGLNKNYPDENTKVDPFNDYGKSKYLAENLIKDWCSKDPNNRCATIIRPTVIFGKNNRGNVYNMLKQVNKRVFSIIGNGKNKKSMAYVSNVADFLVHCLEKQKNKFEVFNYTDIPDLEMNQLVSNLKKIMKIKNRTLKIPFMLAYLVSFFFDIIGFIFNKKFVISSVRVKKFVATTTFNSEKAHKSFKPKYTLYEGLKTTIDYEFKS